MKKHIKTIGLLSFLVLSCLVSSCSKMNSKFVENEVEQSDVRFFGGVFENEVWEEKLSMRRVSWYYRMTLFFETILYRADRNSNFFKWFSPTEKDYFNKCQDLIISVNYAADARKISQAMFIREMELNGYDFVTVNSFAKHLRSHPSYVDWRLQRYKVFGHCLRKGKIPKQTIELTFPSFVTEKVRM